MDYFANATFTHDWVSAHIANWQRVLETRIGDPLRILELGSFEGRSTLFFLQFLQNSRITCVDTFGSSPEQSMQHSRFAADMQTAEGRFDKNTKPFADRIEKIKGYSIEALLKFHREGRRFDVVYVDADHRAASAFADAMQSWDLLELGGIMIIDDYQWELHRAANDRPKAGVDAFLLLKSEEIEIEHLGYQVIVRKLQNKCPSTNDCFSISGKDVTGLAGGMLTPPLVSFVVIAWNYGQYVGQALDSIKRQDYPHFECLVINNGSTDDSTEVIARHVSGDSRFRVATLPTNLGQLGAAFWALDKISGGFVTFVDADDVLLENYASSHLQAHMALPQNVAYTSSNVAEMNADGGILASSYSNLAIKRADFKWGLRPSSTVLRLPTVSNQHFDMLARNTATIPRWTKGWLWGPGTANMYRTSILRLVSRGDGNTPFMRSADGYFNVICHGLAGSAIIGLPLSGYRLHGTNYYSTLESLSGIRQGSAIYTERAIAATVTDVDFVLENAEKLSWMLYSPYWDLVDCITRAEERRLRKTYSTAPMHEVFIKNAPILRKVFGPRVFSREILKRYSGQQARQILRAGFDGHLPPRALLEMANSRLRSLKKRSRKKP